MLDLWGKSVRILSVQPSEEETYLLLGRRPRPLPLEDCRRDLQGQTVLVTGAGGFIGSEICRTLLQLDVKCIVGLDRSEQALASLTEELSTTRLIPRLEDMRDRDRFRKTLQGFQPSHLYHAAAYKNVPFLEQFLFEATENNVLATWDVAVVAREAGVQRFAFVSSDKAAAARNLLGSTKRCAERLLAGFEGSGTRFASVRCANVLGSPGSVLPRFLEQIVRGGPLTVTSPAATRYFMTAAEAAHAVVLGAHLAREGDVLVPDVGSPLRIIDLAANLVATLPPDRQAGLVQRFTGLRAGDQENERLVGDCETVDASPYSGLHMVRSRCPKNMDSASVAASLRIACDGRNADSVTAILRRSC